MLRLLTLLLWITVSVQSTEILNCTGDRKILNEDCWIKCRKASAYSGCFHEIGISCSSWNDFSNLKVEPCSGKTSDVKLTFADSVFPKDFDLHDFVKSLGLNKIWLLTLIQPDSSSLNEVKNLLTGTNVTHLEVFSADFESIPKSLKSPDLATLKITHSELGKIERSDFSLSNNLLDLELTNNNIKINDSDIFDDLVNLRSIDLSSNQLRKLPAGIFKNLKKLTKIILSENELEELPADLVKIDGNDVLDTFILSDNNLKSLPDGFFANTTLKTISLGKNKLFKLSADLFQGASSLKELSLNDNKLENLPPRIFEGTALEILNLATNKLVNITSEVLMGLNDLTYLDISENLLQAISSDLCDHRAPKLQVVQLSKNYLSNLDHHTLYFRDKTVEYYSLFSYCFKLQYLDLSNNKISIPYYDMIYGESLAVMRLSHNDITNVTLDLAKLNSQISLDNNKIFLADVKHLFDMPEKDFHSDKKAQIDLRGNPWKCDCQNINLLRYVQKLNIDHRIYDKVKLELTDEVCQYPFELKTTYLGDIDLEYLEC